MKLLMNIVIAGLRFIYFFMKLMPVKHKVVMISRQSNTPSIDFVLLKEALYRQDSTVNVKYLCRTLDGGIQSKFTNKVKYGFHMLTQMKEIATSEVVVLDTYCIVVSLLHHRESLKIIQMWHSIGSMKKFGYTALDTAEGTKTSVARLMRMHKNYSYVFASSPIYQKDLAKGFHCDESIVRIFPLPRVDLLSDAHYREMKRTEILKHYPKWQDYKVIAYCPTFRKDENEMQAAVDALCEALYDDQILVVKLHPLSKVKLANSKAYYASEFSSFDILFAADAVISDYSCIVYEAALLNIPLYFYNFDMYKYSEGRGLAIDYEHELPGIISKEPAKITAAIHQGEYDMNALQQFCNRYVYRNGNAADNIAKFILKTAKGMG